MASIELDWANEEASPDPEAEARELAANFGLTMSVVTEKGPGGGWPVYRFSGPCDVIVAFLFNYTFDKVDRKKFIDSIEK